MASTSKTTKPKRAPARSVKGKEDELVSLAMDVAEEQLRSGKISSQVLTHFLKLGTVRTEYEIEKIRKETELLKAKVEAAESFKRSEAIYTEVLAAMREYKGLGEADADEDY